MFTMDAILVVVFLLGVFILPLCVACVLMDVQWQRRWVDNTMYAVGAVLCCTPFIVGVCMGLL